MNCGAGNFQIFHISFRREIQIGFVGDFIDGNPAVDVFYGLPDIVLKKFPGRQKDAILKAFDAVGRVLLDVFCKRKHPQGQILVLPSGTDIILDEALSDDRKQCDVVFLI